MNTNITDVMDRLIENNKKPTPPWASAVGFENLADPEFLREFELMVEAISSTSSTDLDSRKAV